MTVTKASFEEWRYWLDILARRYRYAAEIHRKNERPEEGDELAETARLAKDLFLNAHTARTAQPPMDPDDLEIMIEGALRTASALAQKTLAEMPIVVRNMQELLDANWQELSWDGPGNQQAIEFFRGERGREEHGVRGGFAGDGGLPAQLARLVDAETSGSGRGDKFVRPGEMEGKARGGGATLKAKAPFNDWWYWSDVLSKRLKLAAEIYRENDEQGRAADTGEFARKLGDLFIGPARLGQKGAKSPEEKALLNAAEEDAILQAVIMWRESLTSLPFISTQMQEFLGVVWQDISWEKGSPAKAVELFWGPKGRTDEGIRSGLPADGGLPGIMMNYLMSERGSSNRSPTQYKTEAKAGMKSPGMGGK